MSDPPPRQSSVEAWVLMSLVYKDLDDFDYRNALMLAERLYAIDQSNEDYRFIYAKCLHLLNDYDGSYAVLKGSETIGCRHLFARSCLDLGNRQVASFSDRQAYWSEGVKALHGALELYNQQHPSNHHWGDDLKSTMRRSHLPSRGSICNLLGELYAKLENIRASSIYLWQALYDSPFKISAYTNLCDIAPDIANFDLAATTNNTNPSSSSSSSLPFASPDDHFKDFTPETAHLDSTTPTTIQHPTLPTSSTRGIDDQPSIHVLDKPSLGLYMPSLRKGHSDNISLDQLRSLVHYSHKMRDTDLSGVQPPRSDIEERKDADIEMIDLDIKKMKTEEAYRNKHGLHKKPPKEKPQQLEVELPELDDLDFLDTARPLKLPSPLRVDQQREESITKPATKLTRLRKGKKRLREDDEDQHLSSIFAIDGSTPRKQSNDDGLSTQTVISAMNRVMSVLRTLARGYMYHSFYHCREAALSLQKLDDRQYDTPRVLCILGKAYYDAGDYESARIFFCRSFYIAPWYCDGIPIYSTCLWYLEREKELNLLAYHMKDNRSHQYEAFVAAGNWSKCAKGGNEPSKWFQKAVDLDPGRSYGHALLGYEEWEKGNCLGAKLHFSNCMVANKRSYLGWYGMATAYQGMEQFAQAKALLMEAARLHPWQPVVLYTLAEVLYTLDEYDDAYHVVCKALEVRHAPITEKLKEKIVYRINNPDQNQTLLMEDE